MPVDPCQAESRPISVASVIGPMIARVRALNPVRVRHKQNLQRLLNADKSTAMGTHDIQSHVLLSLALSDSIKCNNGAVSEHTMNFMACSLVLLTLLLSNL